GQSRRTAALAGRAQIDPRLSTLSGPAALRDSEPGQIREEAALRIPRRCRGFSVYAPRDQQVFCGPVNKGVFRESIHPCASMCAVALGALALVRAFASAKPATTCTGTLAPGTHTSIVVPEGAVCIIESGPLTINAGLTIGAGATFVFGNEETPNETATISGG